MNIIGTILKKGLELKAQFDSDEDAATAQKKQLLNILKTASETSIGKYYNFKGITESAFPVSEFQKRLPVVEYQQMYDKWWKQTLKYPDITWPGKPQYFAKSSGTTGSKPKRMPVTDAFLDNIRQVAISQLTSVSNFNLGDDFFEREMLGLGSSTKLEEVDGHYEGEISAITANNIPFWFEGIYRPGKEISSISDWDERVQRIAEEAPNWDIGAINGIPSWILLMLKKVIEHNKVETIHDLWPGLQIYTTGGVAFEPYRKKFEEVFGKNVHIMDTYLASEGFMAFTARPETMSMQLAYNHGTFFEFVPFDERGFDDAANLLENPETHTIADVEEGIDYALLVTTTAGNYRYMIGDTVRFTDLSRQEIIITGRTKHFLNVVGSQLSESKMDDAIDYLGTQKDIMAEEYTLAAVEDEKGDYYHEWVLGLEDPGKVPDKELAEILDNYLKENNKNYGVARTKALHGVKVFQVSQQRFYDFQEQSRSKGGQIKTKKLMEQDDFLKFKEFVLEK